MIVHAQTWRIWNAASQQYDYCYIFGDIHIQHPVNELQLNALVSTIERAGNKDDVLVLVEDLTYFPVSDLQAVKIFHRNSGIICSGQKAISPMHTLIQCCQQHGIQAINVENRFVQQATLGLLTLRNACRNLEHLRATVDLLLGPQSPELFATATMIDEPLHQLFAMYGLTISAVALEIAATIEQLQMYDDGQLLNQYYTQIANTIIDRMQSLFDQPLDILVKNQQTIFDFYCRLSSEHQQLFLQRYPLFNAELVDAYALHVLYNAHKHKIFMALGAAHVATMQKQLTQLGYELIANYGTACQTIEQAWLHDKPKTYHALDIGIFDNIAQTTKPSWLFTIKRLFDLLSV